MIKLFGLFCWGFHCVLLCLSMMAMKSGKKVEKYKRKDQLQFNSQYSTDISPQMDKLTDDHIIRVERVDFTGDGKLDYICYSAYGKDSRAHEYWITNHNQIYYKRAFNYEVNEVRFLDLDNDRHPEILSVFGNSRRISYAFIKYNSNFNRFDTLFFFIPVILGENGYYSAYVRGIDFLYLRKLLDKNSFELNVAFLHSIKRSSKSEAMRRQKYLPVVLFGGTGVKEIDKAKLPEAFRWRSLEEIQEQIKFAQQMILMGQRKNLLDKQKSSEKSNSEK